MKSKQVLLADDGELAQPEPLPEPSAERPVTEPMLRQLTMPHMMRRLIYVGVPTFIAIFALLSFVFFVMYPIWALISLAALMGLYFLYHCKFPSQGKMKRTNQDNNFTKMISEAIEHFHHQQPTHLG